LVRTLTNAVIVPTAAIQRGAPGTFVYRVEPDHTVAVQKVALGPGDGQKVAILSGLEHGDRVVDDGADRLKDGAKISIAPPPGQPAAQTEGGGSHSRHRGPRPDGRQPKSE
jgi:multidrug efflux system membrane fusion protein